MVMVELFTSAGFKWGSTVLPPLGQHPSSEGGGDGGALDRHNGFSAILKVGIFTVFLLFCSIFSFSSNLDQLSRAWDIRRVLWALEQYQASLIIGCAAQGIMKSPHLST